MWIKQLCYSVCARSTEIHDKRCWPSGGHANMLVYVSFCYGKGKERKRGRKKKGQKCHLCSMTPVAQFADCKKLMMKFKKNLQSVPHLWVQLWGRWIPSGRILKAQAAIPSSHPLTFRTKVGDDGPSAVALPPPSRAHEVGWVKMNIYIYNLIII